MSDDPHALAIVDDPRERILAFLEQFPPSERAEGVHLALRALRVRVNQDLVILAELAHEAHERSYWSLVTDEFGHPYVSEADFFERVLGLGAWRSIYRYIAAGRLLAAVPAGEREAARRAVSEIGVAKSAVLAPVVAEHPEARADWFERARRTDVDTLQRHVTDHVSGREGGYTAGPGERFRAYLLNIAPSIEDRRKVERFFEVGRRVVETDNPVAIFMAAVEETLGTWEAHRG